MKKKFFCILILALLALSLCVIACACSYGINVHAEPLQDNHTEKLSKHSFDIENSVQLSQMLFATSSATPQYDTVDKRFNDLLLVNGKTVSTFTINVERTSSLTLSAKFPTYGDSSCDNFWISYNKDNTGWKGRSNTVNITEYGTYQVYVYKYPIYDGDYTPSRSEVFTINYGTASALPVAPTKTGYTFTGWYTDEACTNKYTASTVTSDITLYAGFRAHTYSVKFNANGGSGTMPNESMTYDQSKALTANAFTKEHYRFKGWSTSASGNVIYADKQSVKNLAATDGAVVELFAIWERSEVSVNFVSDGKTTTTWVAIGSSVSLPEQPTKEGYTFAGWYFPDGTQYTNQTISEDITLTARFEIIRCVVTFVVDGEVYATYICDWGTSLSDALNANDVNPLLMKVEGEYSQNF